MVFDSKEGRGIDSEEVIQTTSQESFPQDYADIHFFVKKIREVIKYLTSNVSHLVANMHTILKQSKRMKGCFKELYGLNADFYYKMFFFANNKLQLYIESCYFNEPTDGPNFHPL